MTKVHPNAAAAAAQAAAPARGFSLSYGKEEVLTVWKKSLLLNCNGFTVFDCKGNLVFRVDNYLAGNKGEVVLMDAAGKPLLTVRRKVEPQRQLAGLRRRGGGEPPLHGEEERQPPQQQGPGPGEQRGRRRGRLRERELVAVLGALLALLLLVPAERRAERGVRDRGLLRAAAVHRVRRHAAGGGGDTAEGGGRERRVPAGGAAGDGQVGGHGPRHPARPDVRLFQALLELNEKRPHPRAKRLAFLGKRNSRDVNKF
ncbi:hypothetical protein EUGRSUZ_A00877 [Eucalyptus grandis]|uniref:Protein LURP-one-related 8 n=2 Tax=Eucalyptus grandis TaxID=71139 RepID=A0A059DE45_EUCGR|nr:hypothetical protein EUGRSUZ_A00877 [Eucalyptus grandis]